MARFLGTVQGNRGEASQLGSTDSGLRSVSASWQGAVETNLYVDDEGYDCYRVVLREWHGKGPQQRIVLKEGRFVDRGVDDSIAERNEISRRVNEYEVTA